MFPYLLFIQSKSEFGKGKNAQFYRENEIYG